MRIVKVVRKGTALLLMCYYSHVQIGTHLCHSVWNVNQTYLSHTYPSISPASAVG
jgi:hypothetical protein